MEQILNRASELSKVLESKGFASFNVAFVGIGIDFRKAVEGRIDFTTRVLRETDQPFPFELVSVFVDPSQQGKEYITRFKVLEDVKRSLVIDSLTMNLYAGNTVLSSCYIKLGPAADFPHKTQLKEQVDLAWTKRQEENKRNWKQFRQPNQVSSVKRRR